MSKKSNKIKLLSLCATLVGVMGLSACSSLHVPIENTKKVNFFDIKETSFFVPKPGLVKTTIKRDARASWLCSVRFSVDGEEVMDISTREHAEIYLTPGPHEFRVQMKEWCYKGYMGVYETYNLPVNIVDGKYNSYRIYKPRGIEIEPTDVSTIDE